jgi:acyl-CoA dehydrogenase
MDFDYSDRCKELRNRLLAFMDEHIYPNEKAYKQEIDANGVAGNRWVPTEIIERLKPLAREQGLWNLFLPKSRRAPEGLSNLDYAPLCEIMGRVGWAPEVFNCGAPDTGNMETLERYASEEHKTQWLEPLLRGEIRSAFAMTEPDVASSDATNIATRIERDGDEYVINGHKWWISGAGDPRCQIYIVMGVTNPEAAPYRRQSMILVPMHAPGLKVVRPMKVFGYDDAPHGHVELSFKDVRVPVHNLIHTEGSGFEIAQARLGPGRIHHCMRLIGAAQRALEAMIQRARTRTAFGAPLGALGMAQEAIALSRCELEQARLLVLQAAAALDAHGAKGAKDLIGMIKIVAPRMACTVIDRAIQMHGAGGLSQDWFLAQAWAGARSLRLADGPDEVHIASLARSMLKE